MAKRPFFPAPFSFLAEHLARDEDFLSEAKAVLQIGDENFETLVRALTEFDGFLDRRALSGIIGRTLPREKDPDAVSHVIWRLSRLVRESDQALAKALGTLKAAIREYAKGLSNEQRGLLGERLERLLSKPDGLARQHKAEQLVEATGRELADLQIICDVRPVFNEDRSEIQGAVPVSTLRLDLLESDGQSFSLEVRLSEQEIADLCAKAESARRKVTLIKKMLSEKEIALPRTPATLDEGERT